MRNQKRNVILLILGLLISLLANNDSNKPGPVYPIIFVHGLTGSAQTFFPTANYLNNYNYGWGEMNVFDVVLEADNDEYDDNLDDVKWEDFYFEGSLIHLGRRKYSTLMSDYVFEWDPSAVFAINFKEERIAGAAGGFFSDDYFDYSDQAGIYKQGYALGKMIKEVLEFTGREKVVLVGHSMGGLAIREYLQRTVDDSPNSEHRWWVDPADSINGHKVARVTTIGTPHLGSNAWIGPAKEKSTLIQSYASAMRDLRCSYDSGLSGIYLFGGNEAELSDNFWSKDINCDGNQNSTITGICENNTYNSTIPLPNNIKYTWIVSDGGQFTDDGDDCVLLNKQWLYSEDNIPTPLNLADTLMISRVHWHESDDYQGIIRGIDEPDQKELAYQIYLGKRYSGVITKNTNKETTDRDLYYLENFSGNSELKIAIEGAASGVNYLRIFDENDNSYLEEVVNFENNSAVFNLNLGAVEKLYLEISGEATFSNWEHPYIFRVRLVGENQAPQISSTTPADTVAIDLNESVLFSVNATDLDGDDLIYQWFDPALVEGETGSSFEKVFTENAPHSVSVVVSDGLAQTSHSWLILCGCIGVQEEVLPKEAALYQNYPNPFNPKTKIKFYNANQGMVQLSIYNLKGQEVAELVNEEMRAGFKEVNFDATSLNSGVYYYQLKTANKRIVKKMIVLK